jgi:hypothetical protein
MKRTGQTWSWSPEVAAWFSGVVSMTFGDSGSVTLRFTPPPRDGQWRRWVWTRWPYARLGRRTSFDTRCGLQQILVTHSVGDPLGRHGDPPRDEAMARLARVLKEYAIIMMAVLK